MNRLPAEFEPQQAILLTWPKNSETWPDQLEQVEAAYCTWISEIIDHQNLYLLVDSELDIECVKNKLTLNGVALNERLHFYVIPTFDSWIRDYGPISMIDEDGELVFNNFKFDGWGGKYTTRYQGDSLVPKKLSEFKGVPFKKHDFILEGGSIEVNGKGTLLTTRTCLLNQNRNSKLSEQQIEIYLKHSLNLKHVIWVDGEIKGDDTDGHIDDAARFVNETTVVCVVEDNPQDENYQGTQQIYSQLKNAVDQDGKPLTVVKLPMPKPVVTRGERLPASYANFLITNKKVLVPIYDCEQDQTALHVLQTLFPKRKVVGIRCNDIVWGLGALHCLSMQIPASQMKVF